MGVLCNSDNSASTISPLSEEMKRESNPENLLMCEQKMPSDSLQI